MEMDYNDGVNEVTSTQEPEVDETDSIEEEEEMEERTSFTQALKQGAEYVLMVVIGAAITLMIIFFHSAFADHPHELPSAQTVRELAAEALQTEPLKEYVLQQIDDCIDDNIRYVCNLSYFWSDQDYVTLTYRFYLDGVECPCGSGSLTPPKIVELSIWQSPYDSREWKISSSDVKITYIDGYIEELYEQAAAGYTIHSDPFTKG